MRRPAPAPDPGQSLPPSTVRCPTAPAAMPRPDYSRPALPLRTEGQKAHDEVYDIIDEKGRSEGG